MRLRRDLAEELAGGGDGVGLEAGDDLRQLDELFDGVAFGDALGAERQQNFAIQLAQALVHQLGHARIHGAAQHQQGAVLHAVQQRVDAAINVADRGIQVAIDGRADHGDDRVRAVDAGGIKRGLQRLAHDFAQQLVGATLHEGHLARVH